ncbi:hypothetical protein ACMDCR_21445 [Labrys okinawensis]|uniref:hypothetical protein n=1 Tax=Labrys okinawensis TaxID=346911 RepID=UPI0039BC839A
MNCASAGCCTISPAPRRALGRINAEILFAKPWGGEQTRRLPRANLGTTLNFGGGTSTVYAGAASDIARDLSDMEPSLA